MNRQSKIMTSRIQVRDLYAIVEASGAHYDTDMTVVCYLKHRPKT